MQKSSTRSRRKPSAPPQTEINLEEARRFLQLLDPSGSAFTFQTFPDKDDPSSRAALTRVLHGTFDQHADALVVLNSHGAGIFVMVNEGDGEIHSGSRTCRTAKNVVRVRA